MHLMLCLSTLSTLVFVAPTQHLMQVWKLCIKWPLTLPGGKAIVWAFHFGGLAVHQSVQGGSFVNFLGLVKLQGWLQARHTANPQFLKLKGAQQPSNSYISMTKLHPPYPNWTCHKQIIENLEHFNTWSVGACEVPWALAGSDAYIVGSCEPLDVPINAGVPTDPHSPESNSSYLAQIWSIRKLYSLCASCTVNK